MQVANLACGHQSVIEDYGETIPLELDCPDCGQPRDVLIIQPLDEDGNVVHWYPNVRAI